MKLSDIPQQLKDYPYWCVWRLEERDGKKTKIPYCPNSPQRMAKSNDPDTFTPFAKAVTTYEAGSFDGLGIGLFKGFAAVDIDNCIDENGQLSAMALDIIVRMDSYTEYSPSGKGIRIIFRAPDFQYDTAKYYVKNSHNGLETYIAGCTRRYVTITGNVFDELKPIEIRSKEIAGVLDDYMLRAPKPITEVGNALTLSDNEVIEKAHKGKNGAAFAVLWNGDITGFKSQSEAELSFCNRLAFWCGRDTAQMDRLFRVSGLMRDKWDRPQSGSTYGALTIQKAISDCRDTYNPASMTPTPREAFQTEEKSVKPADFTDTDNAYVFAREYKGRAIYVKSVDWLVWNGKKWEEGELEAAGLAMKLTDRMIAEAKAEIKAAGNALTVAEVAEDKDAIRIATMQKKAAEAYRSHAKASRNQPKIAAMLKLARTPLQVKADKLDANAFLLNTPAGMVDLRTGEILPHDPKKLCTKITSCSPGTKGAAMFEQFLATISQGDTEFCDFLQQIAGMAVIGKVFEENLIILFGTGANGKSTFFNALSIVLGDYAGTIAAEVLTTANRNKGAELATLKGKRLIVAAELEEGARLSISMVKQLGSTDKIHAERKYKDPEDFTPTHSTVLYTNHLPRVGSTDNGTWRRLIPVPFTVKIDPKKAIKNYADVLAKEAGDAFLAWVVEGAIRFCKAGHTLRIPDFVQDAIEEYKSENDWMSMFLSECCETGAGKSIGSSALYDAYRNWAERTGEYKRHARDFKAELERRGFRFNRDKTCVAWFGITLKPDDYSANTCFVV